MFVMRGIKGDNVTIHRKFCSNIRVTDLVTKKAPKWSFLKTEFKLNLKNNYRIANTSLHY